VIPRTQLVYVLQEIKALSEKYGYKSPMFSTLGMAIYTR